MLAQLGKIFVICSQRCKTAEKWLRPRIQMDDMLRAGQSHRGRRPSCRCCMHELSVHHAGRMFREGCRSAQELEAEL